MRIWDRRRHGATGGFRLSAHRTRLQGRRLFGPAKK